MSCDYTTLRMKVSSKCIIITTDELPTFRWKFWNWIKTCILPPHVVEANALSLKIWDGPYLYLFQSLMQWSGRFLGIITGWDPSVCKSNRLPLDILQFSFIKYPIDSSIMIGNFLAVLKFNRLFLKLNRLICNCRFFLTIGLMRGTLATLITGLTKLQHMDDSANSHPVQEIPSSSITFIHFKKFHSSQSWRFIHFIGDFFLNTSQSCFYKL